MLDNLFTVQRLYRDLLFAVSWFSTSPLLAQAEGGTEKNYGVSYILVILSVVLGMLVVCRPLMSRADRIERPKEEDD